MISSQEILERNKRVEMATDKFGRIFKVKRLPLGEQLRVIALAGESSKTIGEALIMAASVLSVSGSAGEQFIPRPKTVGELFSSLDAFGEEGIAAIGEALAKMTDGAGDAPVEDAAKN